MQRPTYKTKAYSAASAKSALASTTIPRREPTERDVQIEILFCGICHSDFHAVRDEWNEFMRPAAQTRIKKLLDQGFHKPGDVETRLGYYVGQVGR